MQPQTKIFADDIDVAQRLVAFRAGRDVFEDIAKEAASIRAGCESKFWAATGAGSLTYHYGVEAMRRRLSDYGYEPKGVRNIESAFDKKCGRKIMFQTVDLACVEGHQPQPINDIKEGKQAVIEQAGTFLFEEMEAERREAEALLTAWQKAEAWYICPSFTEQGLSVELSLSRGVADKKFTPFKERIFLLRNHGDVANMDLQDDTPPMEITPIVRKR